jgi:hypothetical protein
MVSGTSTSTNHRARATTYDRMFLVHLAMRDVQVSRVHTSTLKGSWRLGPGEHRRQMQKTPLRQTLAIVCKGRLHNNDVDA